MNTVKHYKDLGLEFDAADSTKSKSGEVFSDPSLTWADEVNKGSDPLYLSQEIVEFAWRKNTGEAPAYKGEIEVKHRDGDVRTDAAAMQEWGICNHRGDIILWRPLLTRQKPQQEKPIFTQEMADAKALVPVGAEFRVHGDENCEDGYCLMRCVGRHVDGGLIAEYGSDKLTTVKDSECLPLKTQRDIEIHLIGELLLKSSENGLDQCELHAAGYRVTKVEE
ncbi:MAG: hypothetical protein ACPG8A_13910 [Psychrobium sp.]